LSLLLDTLSIIFVYDEEEGHTYEKSGGRLVGYRVGAKDRNGLSWPTQTVCSCLTKCPSYEKHASELVGATVARYV